jgi:potassium channel LctB
MIFSLSLLIIFVCLFMSLRLLFIPDKIKGKQVSFENFLFLAFIYVTVTIGFGFISY